MGEGSQGVYYRTISTTQAMLNADETETVDVLTRLLRDRDPMMANFLPTFVLIVTWFQPSRPVDSGVDYDKKVSDFS